MSQQLRLVSIIQSALSQYSTNISVAHNKDEAAFWCPICKLEHHKKKLTIKIDSSSDKFGNWQCWNCNVHNNMRGKNAITLLKKINASSELISSAQTILSSLGYNSNINAHTENIPESIVTLPSEYIPFTDVNKSPVYKKAFNYLLNRGVTTYDIIKYNIGYCEEGKYKNFIIVPSYDKNNNVNYFITRSFINNMKINPPIIRNDKIIFESYINWKMPIFITEGVFDAIALRRNAIPILSKFINTKLYESILTNKVPEVVLVLDADAIAASHKYIKYFLDNDINVKHIDVAKHNIKDAGSSDFETLINLYHQTPQLNYSDFLQLKLESL